MVNKNKSQEEKFFLDGIKDYRDRSIGELQDLVFDKSGYIRSRSLIELAYRGLSEIVLEELVKIENQKTNAIYNLSVSQIAALAIIDFGTTSDLEKLRIEVNNWEEKYQKEDLLDYLRRNNRVL